tara:strand:+ start:52 stop:513 length:462 start_codon:yes stop_codon:yes gene_type:complete
VSDYLRTPHYQIDLLREETRKTYKEFIKIHNEFRSLRLNVAEIKEWAENELAKLYEIPQEYELDSKYECHIYFIRCLDSVKIGYSKNPRIRLSALQTANPNKLELLYSFPSFKHREETIHEDLVHLRKNGEWFKYNDEIDEYIKTIKMEEKNG